MSFVPKLLIFIGWVVLMISLDFVDFTKESSMQIHNGRDKVDGITPKTSNENAKKKATPSFIIVTVHEEHYWIDKCDPKMNESISVAVSECKADQRSEEENEPFSLEQKLVKGSAANNGTHSAIVTTAIRTTVAIIVIFHLVLFRGQLLM